MPLFSRIKTWASGETLYASDLNSEFNNIITNTIPASIEDYSADAATMRLTTDPGGSGSESLATSLAEEIRRIRYALNRIVGKTYWYEAPVSSLEQLGTGFPTASIIAYGGTTAPTGWLLCDGSAVSRTTYSALFAVIAETAGQGDNSTTFNVPDLRGRFLRGMDAAVGRDPDAAGRTAMATGGNTGDNLFSIQAAAYLSHTHDGLEHTHKMFVDTSTAVDALATTNYASYAYTNGAVVTDYIIRAQNVVQPTLGVTTSSLSATNASGGNETRPLNVNVNYIIKT